MTTSDRSAALAERYLQVRARTELLAGPLTAEDQTVQSMPDVSPTKWHRAHTSWFFETFLLEPSLAGYGVFDPMYGYLFNSYYESVGARHPRPARGVISRPGIAEVAAYRRHVDEAMAALLGGLDDDRALGLVELGLHHEQQHQELLLMDAKHVLSCNPLQPLYREAPATWGAARAAAGPSGVRWLEHPGGLVEIGHDGEGFAFDNESPRHRVALEPFALAADLVTCGQWAQFVADGGYRRPELWLSDGWATVQAEGWEAPLYWSPGDRGWQVFTLHGPEPLEPGEPVVHVSYYEADAFARWAGARLPTEAEWEAFAAGEQAGTAGRATAGDDDAVLHPLPGRAGLMGEVWQWTSSAYSPYPGFHPAPGAVGEYNGKFMVNQMVLRGGCCATPSGHARPTYRNFFAPPSRWAFSGLRLARDA
ncbi:MAG: ergothioneine biosynthesis protein EgtB [Acidobacteriota bacterium]|nr:ergothioneine biosynthesis protein EgtB [Acidobacteriota bacterium]